MIASGQYVAVTFVEAPLSLVASAIVDRLARVAPERKLTVKAVELTNDAFPAQNCNPPNQSVLLWEPRSKPGGTALFANLQDGWHTLVYGLGIREGFTCVSVRSSSDKEQRSIRELTYYKQGIQARFVRVMRDDPRWAFYEEGDRLAFEDELAYQERFVRKRLPLEALIRYCDELGWKVADPETWRSNQRGQWIVWAYSAVDMTGVDGA